MYIERDLASRLVEVLSADRKKGMILSGIVGCGKTTLIKQIASRMDKLFDVFSFTGDDSIFRRSVADDSKFILEHVKSRTSRRALVIVDEVQKSENIFDAIKMAFDEGDVSFIVSGSNPEYLATVARKRLQRRAEAFFMLPLGLPEILASKGVPVPPNYLEGILWDAANLSELKIPELTVDADIRAALDAFLRYGGLPLAYLSRGDDEKLSEIRMTVERGFDLMSVDNNEIADKIRTNLAELHSREFTYKNILERTRLRRRETINQVIDGLINHGYLVKKKPMLLGTSKESYFSVFSYVDPGIVSYLNPGRAGDPGGFQVEGYVHARLAYHVRNSVRKSVLGYFKPFSVENGHPVRFMKGEIDFVFKYGNRIIPIEVKKTDEISNIDVTMMKSFISDHVRSPDKVPFGIVFYSGAPYIDRKQKIAFLPYWLV